MEIYRDDKFSLPTIEAQQSVTGLIEKMKLEGTRKYAEEIFRNRQRTSSRNGNLKSEAVLRFAEVLKEHVVDY